MIIYFTGTGNSEFIAKEISKAIDDQVVNMIDLMNDGITKVTIKENERFGFVCPAYWYGLPSVVEDFLAQTTFSFEGSEHYNFFVGHYGNDYGFMFTVAQKAFADKGIGLNAYYNIVTVGNWCPWHTFYLLDPKYIKDALGSEREGIDRVVECIIGGYQNDPLPDQFPPEAYTQARDRYEELRDTRLFRVDSDKCDGCGMCEQGCPVHAIELQDDKPVWIEPKCTVCLGCLSHCPREAIDYEEGFLKYGRHVHP